MNIEEYVKQNDNWDKLAQKLHEAKRLKSYYSKLHSSLSKELVNLSGEQNCVGKEYVFHSYLREGSVDYSSIPQLKEIDLSIYRKEDITIWKLENVGENVLNIIKR